MNKNWAVVAIQLVVVFVTMTGLVVLIAIPLVLAAVVFGSNLTEIVNNFSMEYLARLITARHLTIAIVIALVLTIYIIAMFLLLFFIYGASCGLLGRSVREPEHGFTLKGFYVEGKRMFFPLLGFNVVIGLIAVTESVVIALCYLFILSLRDMANAGSTPVGNFIDIFSALITLTVLFFLLTGTLSVNVYGTAILALRGGGVFSALRGSVLLIINRPSAYWFYIICIVGFVVCSLVMVILVAIISMIPLVGKLLAIPLQLLIQVAQSYMGLLAISSVFSYYHGLIAGGSSPQSGILTEVAVSIDPPAG
ncbi:MAG: hypothetical protein HQL03_00415 [Nitrospirae bacterium]|nr:hypothetical protein [Nitrospirota bacterium]